MRHKHTQKAESPDNGLLWFIGMVAPDRPYKDANDAIESMMTNGGYQYYSHLARDIERHVSGSFHPAEITKIIQGNPSPNATRMLRELGVINGNRPRYRCFVEFETKQDLEEFRALVGGSPTKWGRRYLKRQRLLNKWMANKPRHITMEIRRDDGCNSRD